MSYIESSKLFTLPILHALEEQNDVTIATYDSGVFEYIKNTPQKYQKYHEAMLEWINSAISYIPNNGSILEIGSATPRDANYIRSKGPFVQCSDVAEGFIENLRSQGEYPLQINLLNTPLKETYDMIFANAVAPHFSKEELKFVLKKVYDTLQSKKVFAFNVKRGFGEAWIAEKLDNKRFVRYWQPEEIKLLVEECGFEILFMDRSAPGDLPNHTWVNLVAQKP